MSNHDMKLAKAAPALAGALQHLRTKDAGDAFELLAERIGELTDIAIRRSDESDAKLKTLGDRFEKLDMKANRPHGIFGRDDEQKSWGEQFSENPQLKSFAEERGRPTRLRMDVKTTMTLGAASGGPLQAPTRDMTVSLPQRRLTIRDILPKVAVSTNTVEYASMTARPSAAAAVAEGAVKPESAMAFALINTPTQVIAHWIPASVQILSDAPQLRDIIDGELRYGLQLAEETQLLSGTGVSPNLNGMIPQATAYVDPLALATPTLIDRIGTAILQTALADFIADAIVMHPSDWMRVRLLKDADGKYLVGDPQANVTPNLFGVPVVVTKAIPVTKFLVGQFQVAATLYDRWEARVEVSTEHSDFFVRNLVAIRAEERIALAVKQPLALTYGTLP